MKKSIAALVYLVTFLGLTNGEPVPQEYTIHPSESQETVVTEKSFLLYTTSSTAHQEEGKEGEEEQPEGGDTRESQGESADAQSEAGHLISTERPPQEEEDAGEKGGNQLHGGDGAETGQEKESQFDTIGAEGKREGESPTASESESVDEEIHAGSEAVDGESEREGESPTASERESVDGEIHAGSEAVDGEGEGERESSTAGGSESLGEVSSDGSGSDHIGTRPVSVTDGSPLSSLYTSSEISELNPTTSTVHETVISEPGFLLYTDDHSLSDAGTTKEEADSEAISGSPAEDCESAGNEANVKSPLSVSISGSIRLTCKEGPKGACDDHGEQ
ncbi:unnamed protein product [Calicophoron daubneyi]|uniref:Uncharacterized protein n=1 Tax=Calicophoron daubneyi TaxID=300641 RepID=A0AAV2SYV1_CALDB